MRLLHTLGFEGGLIFITIPVISWFLSISILQALLLEAGFLLFKSESLLFSVSCAKTLCA